MIESLHNQIGPLVRNQLRNMQVESIPALAGMGLDELLGVDRRIDNAALPAIAIVNPPLNVSRNRDEVCDALGRAPVPTAQPASYRR